MKDFHRDGTGKKGQSHQLMVMDNNILQEKAESNVPRTGVGVGVGDGKVDLYQDFHCVLDRQPMAVGATRGQFPAVLILKA